MSPAQYSRRTTLGLILASAGLAASCGREDSAAAEAVSAARSGPIDMLAAPSLARAALVHDALMLLASDSDLTGEWQDMLLPLPVGKPFEFSYAYGVASLADDGRLAHDIALEVRSDWQDRDDPFMDIQRHKGEMLERRLGIAVGWAANHVGASILFEGISAADGAVGLDGAFVRALMGVEDISEAEATRTFRLLYERTFVAMHTLEPDLDGWGGLDIAAMHEVRAPRTEDVNRFIDDYIDWVEQIDAESKRLGAAVAGPAPKGLAGGTALYDTADPIVEAVENLRLGYGRAYAPGHWRGVSSNSRYARALAEAHRAARQMLDVARGQAEIETLSSLTAS